MIKKIEQKCKNDDYDVIMTSFITSLWCKFIVETAFFLVSVWNTGDNIEGFLKF